MKTTAQKLRKPKMQKYTRMDFEREFPTDDACLEWLKNYLYPEGIFCQTCDKVTKHHKVKSRRSYSCDYCGHHVHPTANTIYHKSPTPLRSWFLAIYLMAQTRCGISAKQIERELGVTYKCAWRMFKQIRSMLAGSGDPLSGTVEIDETYVGGKPRYPRKGKGRGRGPDYHRITVVGAVERDGRLVARKIESPQGKNLIPFIKETVKKETRIITDEWSAYRAVPALGYTHDTINHSQKVYARGDIHTNTIEGFWSLVKNGIRGVYHGVGEHYLQTYLDEYAFRYSRRYDETPMFRSFLTQARKSSN